MSSTSRAGAIACNTILPCLGIIVVGLRFHVRTSQKASFRIDDWLQIPVLVSYLVRYIWKLFPDTTSFFSLEWRLRHFMVWDNAMLPHQNRKNLIIGQESIGMHLAIRLLQALRLTRQNLWYCAKRFELFPNATCFASAKNLSVVVHHSYTSDSGTSIHQDCCSVFLSANICHIIQAACAELDNMDTHCYYNHLGNGFYRLLHRRLRFAYLSSLVRVFGIRNILFEDRVIWTSLCSFRFHARHNGSRYSLTLGENNI
jgi:hypothetical protein